MVAGGLYFDYAENNSSQISIQNSILWENDGSNNSSIFASHVLPSFSYSFVQHSGSSTDWNPDFGIDEGYNLDADPLLVVSHSQQL